MDIVKPFRLGLGEMNHLHCANAEAFLDKTVDDEAGIAGFNGIGFENCKSSLHVLPFVLMFELQALHLGTYRRTASPSGHPTILPSSRRRYPQDF